MKDVKDIVLSYTFWPMDSEEEEEVDTAAIVEQNRQMHAARGEYAGSHQQTQPR